MSHKGFLPFNEVRSAYEAYVWEHGETPTTRHIADLLGIGRSTVGDALKELRDTGQCLITDTKMRNTKIRRQAAKVTNQHRKCKGCDGPYDQRTFACRACASRHRKRRDTAERLSEPS